LNDNDKTLSYNVWDRKKTNLKKLKLFKYNKVLVDVVVKI